MKIRPASSFLSLDESMAHVTEVKDRAELVAFLREHWRRDEATEENVTIEPYQRDERIGWDTHLICVDGHAALFSDGGFE